MARPDQESFNKKQRQYVRQMLDYSPEERAARIDSSLAEIDRETNQGSQANPQRIHDAIFSASDLVFYDNAHVLPRNIVAMVNDYSRQHSEFFRVGEDLENYLSLWQDSPHQVNTNNLI